MLDTIDGVDLSNLQGHPDSYRNEPWYIQAGFAIIQALEPPFGYPGHDFIDPETGKRGYTGVQLRTAVEDGKYVGVYPWLWNGLADTRWSILSRLATVPPSVTLDMRPFVDTEDTTGGPLGLTSDTRVPRVQRQLQCEARPFIHTLAGVTIASRRNDVLVARAAADEWADGRGLPPSGGYSGPWYESSYLGGWWPDAWPKWWAVYGVDPGSLIGGSVVAHQYTSTPVDRNVLLRSEIISLKEVPVIDQVWLDKKDLVVRTAGELQAVASQITAEASRKGGPRVKETRRLAGEVRARAETILRPGL